MSGIPILVEAAGLRVLVVGGGAVAARKVGVLVAAGARPRVVAPAVAAPVRALADAGRLQWLEREYRESDIADAQLVIAATGSRTVDAAVARHAAAASRLVNVAGAPMGGSFISMASHRRGQLVVGVSAAGVPSAASRIRDAIALRFDERYARALDGLAMMRRALVDRGERDEWRAIAADLLDGDFCDAVERGTLDARVPPWR